MLYFAYGSNLDGVRMLERCPSAQVIGRGVLRGYKLVFQENNRGAVVGNVVKNKLSKVVGIIYNVDDSERRKMDAYEGVPTVYKRVKVDVQFIGQYVGELKCETYIMDSEFYKSSGFDSWVSGKVIKTFERVERKFGVPKDEYLNHILDGYKEYGLEMDILEDVIEEMKLVKEVTREIVAKEVVNDEDKGTDNINVFVYGTLMKGEINHDYMEGAEFIGEAYIEDVVLYDLPYGFPAMIEGNGMVRGEAYRITREMLEDVDMLEGYAEEFDRGMYLRRVRDIWLKGKTCISGSCYIWNGGVPTNSVKVMNGVKWNEYKKRWKRGK